MANPNIALSFKSPQFRSPLDTAARVQQLAANAMATQKAQRETGSLNALRDYISGGGKLDTPEAISAAIQAGADPDTVRALATQNLDVGKFQADRKKVATGRIFNRLPAVDRAGEAGNDQAWVDWLNAYGALGDEEAAEAKVYLNLTGGKYDPAIVKSLMAGAEKYFEKTTPQAKAELTYGLKGEMQETRTGGVAGADQGVYPLQSYRLPTPSAPRGGTVTVEPSVTVEPGMGGPVNADEVERFIQSFPPEAQAAIRQRVNEGALGNIPMGSPVSDGLVTGERGGVGGPFEPTGQQAYGKSPAVSPYPGSAQVPLPRVAGEAGAAERGRQDVRVTTEPVIAGGTKAAELRAQRDNDYPEATGRMKANLARIDNIIETAEALRKHPGYKRIIGPIDAFTLNITPGARGAQELLNTLSALGAVDELQKMRQESPTGGAVGNASDADIQLLREGFGALGQSQGEEDFDVSLRGLINRARQTRDRIANQYRDTYSYRLPKKWSPPPIAKTRPGTPTGKGRKAGAFIVMEPE